MVKSGFKSSEFWVAIVGIGGLVWQFAQTHCSVSQTELLAFAGVVVSYIVGRSYLKARVNEKK